MNKSQLFVSPLLDNNQSSEIPNSHYIDQSFCCFKIAYFPLTKTRVIGHWKVSLTMPIVVIISFMVTLGLFIYDTFDSYPSLTFKIISYTITIFSFLCAFISYFQTICVGPGYLPYNWSLTHKHNFSWNEMMSNYTTFQKQVDFARSNRDRPKRSCYSAEARRIVLRADHFCEWTKSWIGIKNQRYFILLCFWTFFYSLCNICFRFYFFKYLFTHHYNWCSTFGLVSLIAVAYFGFISFYQFVIAMNNLVHNRTLLEKWSNRSTLEFNKGCCGNCEEVCGSRALCLFWPFPFCCLTPLEDGFYSEMNETCSESCNFSNSEYQN